MGAGRLGVAAAAAASTAMASGCGGGVTTASRPAPVVVESGTPIVSATALRVVVHGAPVRTFIVRGGRWRVCDSGAVVNPGPVVAPGVVVTVVYVDHGIVVGRLAAADAATDGGAIGDLAAGASRDFTVCGIAADEPDTDLLQAATG